jgi:hypothetical protein
LGDVLLNHPSTEAYCRVCAVAPLPGQLDLFGDDPGDDVGTHTAGDTALRLDGHALGFPAIETSACGRVGFWREVNPALFGARAGVGPLLVFPDTNILIDIRREIAEIDHGAGFVLRRGWSARRSAVEALQDLIQLWWWRDLRFVVSPTHLIDSGKPLKPEYARAREAAVREFETDYRQRGGSEVFAPTDLPLVDGLCPEHGASSPAPSAPAADAWRWPPHQRDRELAQDAYNAGCHVFLTTERKILRCHTALSRRGLAVLSPRQLIDALEATGELASTRGIDGPAPDLAAMGRLYAGFGT